MLVKPCVKIMSHASWTTLSEFEPNESWHCYLGIWLDHQGGKNPLMTKPGRYVENVQVVSGRHRDASWNIIITAVIIQWKAPIWFISGIQVVTLFLACSVYYQEFHHGRIREMFPIIQISYCRPYQCFLHFKQMTWCFILVQTVSCVLLWLSL